LRCDPVSAPPLTRTISGIFGALVHDPCAFLNAASRLHLPRRDATPGHATEAPACRRSPCHVFHSGALRGGETQGMGIFHSAALRSPSPLPGVPMPKPAQNCSCPGFTQRAMLNADFIASCIGRDISPALDHLSGRASLWPGARWTAPNAKTCSLRVQVSPSLGHALQGSAP